MNLVEKHIIKRNHEHWQECDRVCFLSKNLYNAALYAIRQKFFEDKSYLNYNAVQKVFTHQQDYTALPRKVSCQTLMLLDKNFLSFFKALQSYKRDPSKFQERPQIPKYKDKDKGRNITLYTSQSISISSLRKGIIKLSGTSIELPTKKATVDNICQVRIVPRPTCYVIEVVYEVEDTALKIPNNRTASIDVGLNNLATMVFNTEDVSPIIINGKPLKDINQYYNKEKARLQSQLEHFIDRKGKKRQRTKSHTINRLTFKRNNKINNYLHNASRYIVNQLVSHNISTLVVGKNNQWKQDINIGKVNNQKFVSIPHATFINQLEYKCALVGIDFKLTEESYTSKCSFLDNEAVKKQEIYKGKRKHRGLFVSSKGISINADVNGAANIMKKVFPNAFAEGIEGVKVRPLRVTPYKIAYSLAK